MKTTFQEKWKIHLFLNKKVAKGKNVVEYQFLRICIKNLKVVNSEREKNNNNTTKNTSNNQQSIDSPRKLFPKK